MATLVRIMLVSGLIVLCSPGASLAQGLGAARLVVVDEQKKKLFGYDATGFPTGSVSLAAANTQPQGVGGDGFDLYVVDRGRKQVFRYGSDGAFLGVSRVLRAVDGTSLSRPGGVAVLDDDLWVVDRGRAAIFRYGLTEAFMPGKNLSAAQRIPLLPENARAEGLAVDEFWLYVVDEVDKQVYRYFYTYFQNDGTGPTQVSRVMRQADRNSLGAPSGVTLDGDELVIVDRSRDKVLAYNLLDLFTEGEVAPADGEFRLGADNQDARGVNSNREGTKEVAADPLPDEALKEVNQFRKDNNLPAVTVNDKLVKAAQKHNALQVANQQQTHQFAGEPDPVARVKMEGYNPKRGKEIMPGIFDVVFRENVGFTSEGTGKAMVDAWKASKAGHREAMLDPDVKEIGIAHGVGADGNHYWTLIVAAE
jgi:uncharacterized protein YkwD